MFKINRTDTVDVDTYDSHINHLGYILYDRERIQRDVEFFRCHAETCYDLARMRMVYKSGNKHCYMNRDNILDYLMDYEGCPESFFKTGKSKGYSLDSKRVLDVLRAHGFATEFIDNYTEYKSWSAKCSKLESILNDCKTEMAVSNNGSKLYKLPFTASVQTNRRFNYRDFDIISQIPKSMAECISADDGYFLAWGDFAQSDFRIAYNLFLRTPENDELFEQYDDKYEAIARMLSRLNNEKFDYEKFVQERKLYKRNTLATIYGARSSALEEDAQFIHRFAAFIEKIDGYHNYKARIEQYWELGLPIMVSSYFGFVQQIFDGPTVSKNSVLDVALNTPVQTGSSEIVIFVVNHILKTCYEMGYTEDDICLYLTRHDEPVFRINKSAKGVMSVLHDHSSVIVDDWTPLKLDWNFGYNYGISDEQLESSFKEMTKKFNETKVSLSALCSTTYEPLPPLITFGIAKHETPDQRTIVTFYDAMHNEVMYSIFDTIDADSIDLECKLKIRDAEENIRRSNYKNVVIFSEFLSGVDFWGETNITYSRVENNESVFAAKRLCNLMTWRYCNKYKYEPNVESPTFTSYDRWIDNVKDSRYLIVT